MNIITGYRGEPHITSAQDRATNQGTFGTGSYILNVGNLMAPQIVSSNEIRITDGVLCMQGCVANIDTGAYDTCEISNGTQGMKRSDLIVARYTKDAETNIEDIQLVVLEGTPASSSPEDPEYIDGNIQAGDSPVDFPLFRVNINNISITGVTRIAPSIRTQAETDTLLGSTSISGIGNGTVTGAISTLNGKTSGVGSISRFTVGGSASNTFTTTSGIRGVLFISGATDATKGIYVFASTSAGAVSVRAISAASSATITTSTNAITIANGSSSAMACLAISY